tara:strand:- start:31 stop:732 length:702 start_codon:yes stop_codon:yes gene_type:complete
MSYLKTKPNSLEDMAKQMSIHTNESDYKAMFKKELEKSGKAGIGSMTDKEKKDFFNRIDNKYKAKNEIKEQVNWAEAACDQEKRQADAKYFKAEAKDEIPPIEKDNKPGVKIAKIRAMKDDDKEKTESEVEKLKDQNALLKQKLENEKHKAVKPQPNKDTGEVPLSIGIAYKHLRDKMKKEDIKEDTVDDVKEITMADKTAKRDKEMKEPKGKTDTGKDKTPVEMNPKMNHKF